MRKINFLDGITSTTEPTLGNIVASAVKSYADDAAYEAVEQGSPAAGNFYYNSTTGKIRYYDHVNTVWKDSDNESLVAIALLIQEQLVQDGLIADNSTDIDAIAVILADIQNEIVELNLRNNQDRSIATIGGGKIEFTSGNVGLPAVLDQNVANTSFSATPAAFSFTPTASGDMSDLDIIVDAALASVGTLSIELYNTDVNGQPQTLLSTSDSSDVITWNAPSTPTPIKFTLNTPSTLLVGTKYIVVFVESGFDGSWFSAKDDNETDTDGELLTFNIGLGEYETSTENRDMTFTVNGIGNNSGAGVTIESDMYLQVPGSSDLANTIDAQTFELDNNEVAYVEINRDSTTTSSLTIQTATPELLVPTDNTVVIARRKNDIIYFGVNHTTALKEGESFTLDAIDLTELEDAVALNTAKVSFPEAPIDTEQYVRKDGNWELLDISASGVVDPDDLIFHVEEQQTPLVPGGVGVVGENIRVLNTVVSQTTWGTLNVDGSVTILPGKYEIDSQSTSFRSERNQSYIYFTDTSNTDALLKEGTSRFNDNTGSRADSPSDTYIRVNFTETTTVSLIHFLRVFTAVTTRLGADTQSPVNNVYAKMIIRKVGEI